MSTAIAKHEHLSQDAAGLVHSHERELLSALADGELQGEERARALALACGDQGQATWDLQHLIGDVMRSSDLARYSDSALLGRLRTQMAADAHVPRTIAPMSETFPQQMLSVPAANASVFRWKMAAGFATLAAVAAIGWTSLATVQSSGAVGSELASNAVPAPSAVPTVSDKQGPQVMIRDPRLDELMAAHRQHGGATALQMPAGFLRNANFDTPSR